MLFLWGTLITEPFHIFARFIAKAVHYACKGVGISGIAASLILYVVVVSVIILMQKFEPTKLGVFIPCAISVVFIAMLLVKAFMNRSVTISDAISLAVPAGVALAFYILKFEKGLKWFTDIYTYSLVDPEITYRLDGFDEYDTTVNFISEEEFNKNHSGLAHGGFVIRTGKTGMNKEHTHVIEYSLKLDSNPEFTTSVLVAYARAALRMKANGQVGCKTVLDVPPAYLSTLSDDDLRAHCL